MRIQSLFGQVQIKDMSDVHQRIYVNDSLISSKRQPFLLVLGKIIIPPVTGNDSEFFYYKLTLSGKLELTSVNLFFAIHSSILIDSSSIPWVQYGLISINALNHNSIWIFRIFNVASNNISSQSKRVLSHFAYSQRYIYIW